PGHCLAGRETHVHHFRLPRHAEGGPAERADRGLEERDPRSVRQGRAFGQASRPGDAGALSGCPCSPALLPQTMAESLSRRARRLQRRATPRDPRPHPAAPTPVPIRVPYSPALVIVLLVLLCFSPVLQNGFVNWDDDLNFRDNPSYRGLSPAHLAWMFTTLH